MIVKNESHIIEKTLKMLTETLDFSYWVISDTGSTDNTKKIIKSFFKNLNIPGELVEHEWRDFGYNRTKALESGYNKTDYLFIFDADDWIYGKLVLPELNADMYNLKFGNKFIYKRPLLVNNRLKWKFIGVLHEYISCNELKTQQDIKGEYYIDSGKTGARSQDPQKYIKDALVLENAHKDETDQGLKCRYAFYCAQSYMDANMPEKSIEWYKKVVEGNNWNQEKYYSCLMMANMYFKIDKNEEAILYLSKGDEFDMQRMEHVHRMMDYYYKKNIHLFVNLIYEKYKNYKDKPINYSEKLFLSMDDYNYKIEYLNSISAYYTKNFQSGYQSSKIIINSNDAPEYITKSTMLNFNFYKGLIESDTIENIQELFKNFNKKMCHDFSENNCIMSWNNLYNKINFTNYNSNAISKIKNKQTPKILLSMTTCKRFDLFEKTINSIFNQWEDYELIDYWFLVDDNSSKEDTDKMRQKYPFFDFYFKTIDEKGHRLSMNIIFNKLNELKPQYWIHLEDDFLFYDKMEYISTAIKGLKLLESDNVKQILFNFCYAETINDYKVKGFIDKKNGFFLHDYQPGKRFNYPNSQYWPHYSFRPSLIDVSTILKLGNFDSENQFFEMDYAHKWTNAGYKSAFFDKITNKHIGRLTSERHNKTIPNAYELNNENQFYNNDKQNIKNTYKEKKIPTYLINLDRRGDRLNYVNTIFKYQFERFSAIDGTNLSKYNNFNELLKYIDNKPVIFGEIGCKLSHLSVWNKIEETTLVIEDDLMIHEKSFEIFDDVVNNLQFLDNFNWDILYVGGQWTPHYGINSDCYMKHHKITDENINTIFIPMKNKFYLRVNNISEYTFNTPLFRTTASIILTKEGAQKLKQYINEEPIKFMELPLDMWLLELEKNKKIMALDYFEHPFYQGGFDLVKEDFLLNNDINREKKEIFHLNEISIDDKLKEFVFLKGMDIMGNDLFFNKGTINDMINIAFNDKNVFAFNTLGFFKNKIDTFKTSVYFNSNDGIYIKKNKYNEYLNKNLENNIKFEIIEKDETNSILDKKYINVKMIGNYWNSSEELCYEFNLMTPERNYIYNNIKITWTDENIDYYVIINKPKENDISYYEPNKTIVFTMEPKALNHEYGINKIFGEWANPNKNIFLHVNDHENNLNNVQWKLNIPHEILIKEISDKNINKIASIISYKNWFDGHKLRINFIKHIQDSCNIIDIYGKENYHNFKYFSGALKDDKQENVLLPYKYYLSVENNYEHNYSTEKIWEPILCEQLCFYWGCPNLEEYIDSKAFVRLDLNDFNSSLNIINQAISEDWWSQRIDIIRKEKQKILNELGFFPRLEKILNKNNNIRKII